MLEVKRTAGPSQGDRNPGPTKIVLALHRRTALNKAVAGNSNLPLLLHVRVIDFESVPKMNDRIKFRSNE